MPALVASPKRRILVPASRCSARCRLPSLCSRDRPLLLLCPTRCSRISLFGPAEYAVRRSESDSHARSGRLPDSRRRFCGASSPAAQRPRPAPQLPRHSFRTAASAAARLPRPSFCNAACRPLPQQVCGTLRGPAHPRPRGKRLLRAGPAPHHFLWGQGRLPCCGSSAQPQAEGIPHYSGCCAVWLR